MSYYLGIDLGGSNIAAGIVDENYRIVEKESVPTNAPRPAEALCDDMAALCHTLTQRAGIAMEEIPWVGVGSPGIIWEGTICYANNLALHDAPIAELMSERLGRPVFLSPDANAAAYGEYLAGAGRGQQSLVAVTIGTGIGSGMIVEGRMYEGFNGASPELGHCILRPGGRSCSCGNQGCFETYCSATGLVHSTILAMEQARDSAMWRLCGGDTSKVSGRTAFDAMRLGDPAGIAVVEQYLDDLSVGVAGVVNLLQPAVLCIGGGVSKEGDTIILPLRERVAKQSFAGRQGLRTNIVAAQLGNDAGIIGAAMLGKRYAE